VPDRIADICGSRTPVAAGEEWAERVDVHLLVLEMVAACERRTKPQLAWLTTRMKQAVPRALLVAT
jgi:hypothetical protein